MTAFRLRFSILGKVLLVVTSIVILTGAAIGVAVVRDIRTVLIENENRHMALEAEASNGIRPLLKIRPR